MADVGDDDENAADDVLDHVSCQSASLWIPTPLSLATSHSESEQR